MQIALPVRGFLGNCNFCIYLFHLVFIYFFYHCLFSISYSTDKPLIIKLKMYTAYPFSILLSALSQHYNTDKSNFIMVESLYMDHMLANSNLKLSRLELYNTPIAFLQRGKHPPNECPSNDFKQPDAEAPVMLNLWGMWSTLFIAIAPKW